VIKYLGSKRRLVPVISAMASAAGGDTALDLFSGTARVGSALKAAGMKVTAVDTATYAKVLADTYVATDERAIDEEELALAIAELDRLPGAAGYVTEVFCGQARYFHPDNGTRIDAIRDGIEHRYAGSHLYSILLTSLLEAADRVDSTTGLQMAFLKSWAPRALRPLALRVPALLPGPGAALLGDACKLAGTLGPFDVAYLDPPYNQHRYFGNYHVWETLVRWDAPVHYGIACKRADCRDEATASVFNRRREMPGALEAVIGAVDAEVVLVSHNDESWVTVPEVVAMCRARADCVSVLAVNQARYVGARIGIHNPAGERVGRVSHTRNTEVLVAAGSRDLVGAAVAAGLASAVAAGLEAWVVAEPDLVLNDSLRGREGLFGWRSGSERLSRNADDAS
jgi:adenine-specific DNA-methyltransferase